VTDDWGASYRYRCAHGAEQLRADGVPANVMHIGDPNLLAALPAYSVVVLFRLPWSGRVEALLLAIRRQGATPVFEIDDLIFDPEFEPLLGFLRDLRPSAQREYRERFRRLRRTFDACDAFVGSTPALVRAAVALGRREAILHPNLVPSAYEQLARWLVRRGRMSPPTIAYLSGSNTHDRDFAVASGALARILTDDRRVRLLVCGFVDLPAAMRPFADRVVQIPYQDWRVYPWAVAGCAVTLAPMAVRNAFADAKSALKFFEPGIFGVPVVATPTEPFRAAIVDGETGFLADTEDEWEGRIRQALDPDVGRAVGRRARAAVQAAHTQSANQGRLVALLGPLVGRAIAAPPPALSLEPGVGGPPPLARGEHVRRAWSLVRGRAPEERVVRAAAPWGQPVAAEPFTALLREVDATTAERISTSVPVLRDLVRDAAEWDAWHPSPRSGMPGTRRRRSTSWVPATTARATPIRRCRVRPSTSTATPTAGCSCTWR
jgi:glycosyltransferase involved in cell wall biosynthesis